MDRQTLRDWVHRYNAEGLAGLPTDTDRDASRGSRPSRKPSWPPPWSRGRTDRDGVVRWRRVDLQVLIEARFGVRLHERTVGKVLRRLGFGRVSVRPRHPKADEAAQEAFKKASPSWYARRCPSTPAASRSRSGSRCYEGGHHRQ